LDHIQSEGPLQRSTGYLGMVTAMFPLGTVLFPHMQLPLRIFEPRYLKLLGDLLEDDVEPEFGVVLIERGQEVGGESEKFSFGTMARINQVSANEQFYFIETVGTKRFKVTLGFQRSPIRKLRLNGFQILNGMTIYIHPGFMLKSRLESY